VSGEAVGIVLGGGRSSRMGGGNKSLIELDGEPILSRILRQFATQVGRIAISANDDPARYSRFDLPVLPDPIGGFQGPLAGVLAGLEWANSVGATRLITVAGDTPFFPTDLAARLIARADNPEIAVATSERGTHPTFALWSVALAIDLRTHLESGGTRKVTDYIAQHSHALVAFKRVELPGGAVDPFFNINTPADLAEARRLLHDGDR